MNKKRRRRLEAWPRPARQGGASSRSAAWGRACAGGAGAAFFAQKAWPAVVFIPYVYARGRAHQRRCRMLRRAHRRNGRLCRRGAGGLRARWLVGRRSPAKAIIKACVAGQRNVTPARGRARAHHQLSRSSVQSYIEKPQGNVIRGENSAP